MPLPPINLTLPGPLVGIGIDVCQGERFIGVRQRWGGRVDRVFSGAELELFRGSDLGWPWAAREAIVKALKARMLGSPLAQMRVGWSPSGRLQYRPGPSAREQLARHNIASIRLFTGRLSGCQCVIATAFAPASSGRLPWRAAWGALPFVSRPEGSLKARQAGVLAMRSLVGGSLAGSATWTGGHGAAPHLQGTDLPDTLVSLSHDGGVAAAVVAVPLNRPNNLRHRP